MTLVPTSTTTPTGAVPAKATDRGEPPARVGRQRPRRDPEWMLNQLPSSMASQDFFSRFVRIFQDVGSTLLDDADNIEHVIDVTVAPPELVRWLGEWVGITSTNDLQEELLQRRIVQSAARNLTWRGTARGLTSHLQLLTGSPVEVTEGGGIFAVDEAPVDPGWVEMWVRDSPVSGAFPGTGLDRAELVAAVFDEIPAHVRARLFVGPERVLEWSTQSTDQQEIRTP